MQIRCPSCRVPFESEEDFSWSDIDCPSCGANFSLSGDDSTRTYNPGFEVLGRFVLLQPVGAGQFGSVWKALDTQLRRNVAVKIPRQQDLDARQTEMFLRDARAAAQLKHPRIASVHEIGREGNVVYIVTDYIDGANLHEWLSRRRLSVREAAELMVKIAEAVHHAHECGIVHRDLKPSNIMMDANGEPYVIDFGLARREIGELTLTMEGQVLGTPAYMSPEQARGQSHQADRRSDTYSLGVILFKLLTGELPFRGQTRMLILQILEHEPPNPRQLDANVPRDLATIALKCLEKAPEKRYQTAGDLADDLKRYLASEPIRARPVGRVERAWRWCKRRPDVAALTALLLLMLLAVSIVAPIVAVYQAHLRHESELRRIDLQNQVANNFFQRASEEYNAGRQPRGIALLSAAYELVDSQHPLNRSIRRLMPGWLRECGNPIVNDHVVLAAAISPDGNTAVIGVHNPTSRLWDVATRLPFGEEMQHENSIRAVAFSPDGKTVLTGGQDGTARLWDAKTGRLIGKTLRGGDEIWAVCFVPDGSAVITGGRNEIAQTWDVKTGEALGAPFSHHAKVMAVAVSPNGRTVVTGGMNGAVQFWDAQLKEPLDEPIQLRKPVYALSFSPDGSKILVGSANKAAQIWDADTRKLIGEMFPHQDLVYSAAFGPDGRTAISGSFDNTARLWDIATGQPLGGPLHHGGKVMSAQFSPDGHTAVTGSADGTARFWTIRDARILRHDGRINAVAFNPNGHSVVSGGSDKTTRIWDVRTGRPIGEPMQHDAAVVSVGISPDGRKIVTGCRDRQMRTWDARNGEPDGEPWQVGGTIQAIRICPSGTTTLVTTSDEAGQAVQQWDYISRKPSCDIFHLKDGETLMAASQDGQSALVRQGTTQPDWCIAQLWDVATGKAKGQPLRHKAKIMDAVFTSDGREVITAGFDQEVRRWNAQTGEPVGNAMRHEGIVYAVAIDRDARTILSGSDDKTARLWDMRTGSPLGSPLQDSAPISKVALSPNGDLALTIRIDGTSQLWDVGSSLPIMRPLQFDVSVDDTPFVVKNAEFSADGSTVLFECADGTARLYEVPQALSENRELIRTWARTQSGFALDDKGVPRQLSHSEWLEAQQKLTELQWRE